MALCERKYNLIVVHITFLSSVVSPKGFVSAEAAPASGALARLRAW